MRAALAALALLAAGTAARADTKLLSGHALVLSAGEAGVSIEPDPGLARQVRLTADGSCSIGDSEGAAVTIVTDACDDSAGTVVIAVPPGFPVTVNSHGGGDVRVGNTQSPLTVNLNGGGELKAGEIGPLVLTMRGSADASVEQISGAATVEITGSGDLRVQRLNGALRSGQHGSGNLAIGAITAPDAQMSIHGSGDAVLGNGTVGNLSAEVSGGGDLGVSAVIANAQVRASGGSDVKLGQVTGSLVKDASGGSSIYVGAGLLSAGLGKLAEVVADPANDKDIDIHDGSDGSTVIVHRGGGGGDNTVWHIVSAAIVIGLLYLLWRTVQRRGGITAVQARLRTPASPAAATHPGVIAVRDSIARLDGRLARLEGYVTSREFDLHRKFRELDTQ